tara:strand:+ start:195 stop:341 length:147 start_codon:yes stop_codon:yes gene_type:complete
MVLLVSSPERVRGADLAFGNIRVSFLSGVWAGPPKAFESLFVDVFSVV